LLEFAGLRVMGVTILGPEAVASSVPIPVPPAAARRGPLRGPYSLTCAREAMPVKIVDFFL
jgi:hypothetical protein